MRCYVFSQTTVSYSEILTTSCLQANDHTMRLMKRKKSLYVVFCPTLGINCVCVNHDINSNSLKKTKCLVVCEITVYVVFCKVKWLVKAI